MLYGLLSLTLAGAFQPVPHSPDASFSLPAIGPGAALFDPRNHSVPVRVCGIPVATAGYGPNTFLLKDFQERAIFVEITQRPPTLENPCVTGVVLRTDGITWQEARRLNLRTTASTHAPDRIFTLYECADTGSCQSLVDAVERRSRRDISE